MNLLLSQEGDVLGTTPTKDNAQRHQIMRRMPLTVVTSLKEMRELPANITAILLSDYQASSLPDLWKKLRDAKGLPKWGKVSVKELMRCLYTRNPKLELDEDELLEAIPGASWDSIVTAISMLKNPKYSDGPTMLIHNFGNRYRLATEKELAALKKAKK